MDVGMGVDVLAVAVRVAVDGLEVPVLVVRRQVRPRDRVEATRGVEQPEDAEQDQHRGDDELEPARDARAEGEPEPDDERPRERERRHVAQAPEDADERAVGEAALARDDRRDGDEVVGIGRVLEPEDEAEDDRRDDRVH
jgi:hypothetical protein